ncbi:MAG: aminotransferase class III-fold pyridoxal phosphate-dependent enzyme [Chitinophagales bacterium]|nr:aspartate aminotransferase family protein [Bacteroidota bacterium]
MQHFTQRQLFLQHVAQTSDAPLLLEIVRAHGMYLYDASGKKYLDLIAGISVSNLGHTHPKIVAAVQEQAEKYMHLMVYGEYVYTPQVLLSKTLAEILPSNLQSVYLVNSGAEAVEGAMKLAKRFTKRKEFISFNQSYHGSTQGALSLSGDDFLKTNYRPLLPHIAHLPYNDMAALSAITTNTAAVFAEVVQAEAGVFPADAAFLQALRQKCTETGTLLVFDEIQTGMGRSGKMFAFEHYNIVPDILLLAKAFGGGLPIGAFIASQEIMRVLTFEPVLGHITTFGGNAVCAAAALAHLQTLLGEPQWIDSVAQKEALFNKLLQHPAIKAVRGKGLLLAMELESAEAVQFCIGECLERGIVTDWFLYAPHCVRIAPPLIITDEQISWVCSQILEILAVWEERKQF